jgi:hypothetical protein
MNGFFFFYSAPFPRFLLEPLLAIGRVIFLAFFFPAGAYLSCKLRNPAIVLYEEKTLHVLLFSQCSTSLHETVPQFLVKVRLEKRMHTL